MKRKPARSDRKQKARPRAKRTRAEKRPAPQPVSIAELRNQIESAARRWPKADRRELVNLLIDQLEEHRPKDRDRDCDS